MNSKKFFLIGIVLISKLIEFLLNKYEKKTKVIKNRNKLLLISAIIIIILSALTTLII